MTTLRVLRPPADPLLRIESLHVSFATRRGTVDALRGIDLAVDAGETLGIVGESGSGKSVTAMAALRLLDRAGRITAGRVMLCGEDLTTAPARRLRAIRGAVVSMIFQNPRAALNPIRTVGAQIADALRAHQGGHDSAVDLLRQVRIREPERRLRSYPHELSGGMCQRVMIAMAVACAPRLLIADEPTTGLDVTTQKAVMDMLAELSAARGMALILITHDLGLAARYCGRIAVMEAGRVVETAPADTLFRTPRHDYTRRLVAASPTSLPATVRPVPGQTLLEVTGLSKRFADGTLAVDGIDLRIGEGESLGLVGESGSGKTTIARLVARLLDPDTGEIRLGGQRIGAVPARAFHREPARFDVQIVFQDAGESLNPRFTAFDCIADPLRRLGRGMVRDDVMRAADRVGLPAALLTRLPHQLSGGQMARVGIARALATRPRLLVLDEPTAALDASVQKTVLDLLAELRRDEGLTYLFVSHDLNVVRRVCDRTMVLRQGRVVEEGPSDEVLRHPRDPYTMELVAAIPMLPVADDAIRVGSIAD